MNSDGGQKEKKRSKSSLGEHLDQEVSDCHCVVMRKNAI